MSWRVRQFLAGSLFALISLSRIEDTEFVRLEMSHAAVVSKIVLDETVPESGYSSVLSAVRTASDRYNPDSIARNREHVGGILRCGPASHYYTHAVGERGIAPVTFSISVPAGCSLVALWHTHGGAYEGRGLFSSSDTDSANRLGLPMYMTNHTGDLRIYRPGGPTANRTRTATSLVPLPAGTSPGHLVRLASGEPIRVETR